MGKVEGVVSTPGLCLKLLASGIFRVYQSRALGLTGFGVCGFEASEALGLGLLWPVLLLGFLGFSVTRGEKSINFYFIMVPLRKKY